MTSWVTRAVLVERLGEDTVQLLEEYFALATPDRADLEKAAQAFIDKCDIAGEHRDERHVATIRAALATPDRADHEGPSPRDCGRCAYEHVATPDRADMTPDQEADLQQEQGYR